jgi:tripartite-type tricarboxylate transporter receptor subunit TctC
MSVAIICAALASFGCESAGGTPEQFTTQIKRDASKCGEVIKRASIKPN